VEGDVTRFELDPGVRRFDTVIIGGSPLRLFRVSPAGARLVDRIAAGHEVATSRLTDALLDAGAIHPLPAEPPFGRGDVTIVRPVHRTEATDVRYGAEQIVVDDASPIAVSDAVVRFPANRGAAAARNAGLELVETPLVAFVDDDVELPDGWLDALLPHFSDRRLALVAPRVVTPDAGTPVSQYEQAASPLDLGTQAAPIVPGSRVSYVPAAAIVCRVDAVRAIGGFDEALRFGEDVDLVWRLHAAGWRCRFEPASNVRHPARPNWVAWFRQRVGYGSSAAPLARRHPGALAPVRMSGWSVAVWALATLVRPPAGPLAGAGVAAGTAVALLRKLPDVPPGAAFGLAWRGNLHAGGALARAVRRAWWPVVAIVALRSRAARRALLLSVIAGRRPIALVDDIAYSVGVWRGMVTERTAAPLVPAISSWPGKGGDELYRRDA
jgi:mycofactocin system glycosyltransferase